MQLDIISSNISTKPRIIGLLTAMSQELPDSPLYYYLPELASVVHSKIPSFLEIQSALIHAGYEVSQFHKEPMAIKTNASNSVVWDIMRAYCQLFPPKQCNKVIPTTVVVDPAEVEGEGSVIQADGENQDNAMIMETDGTNNGSNDNQPATTSSDNTMIVDSDGMNNESNNIQPASTSSANDNVSASTQGTKRYDVAAIILSKKSAITVDFTPHPQVKQQNGRKRIARFPPNPESNWGPKRKATSNA